MAIHKLSQGEDIVSITAPLGIPWRNVWELPENSTIRKLRSSPHILMPGDEVFLPELEKKHESGGTETRHRFKTKGQKVRLRLRIFDTQGNLEAKTEVQSNPSEYEEEPLEACEQKPVADVPYELIVDDARLKSGQTDSEGFVDEYLPVTACNGILVLNPGEISETRYNLNWRHMNPVEELSGVCQRLTNMGFPCPDEATEMSFEIEMAIVAFQKQYNLEPNGELDDEFRSFLCDQHGS